MRISLQIQQILTILLRNCTISDLLKQQNWDINNKRLTNAPKLRIVTGRHAHSTVLKAVSLLGFGTDNIEWVEVDDQGRIIADQIPALDKTTILILQAGNVNSGSFDDFKTICTKARSQGAWIHIDGAFGLWASASNKLKYLTEGIEMGDSMSVDGHKTLNTPYDSGIFQKIVTKGNKGGILILYFKTKNCF